MTSDIAINGGAPGGPNANPQLTAAEYLNAVQGGYTICDCQPPQFIPYANVDAFTFVYVNQTIIAGGSTVNSLTQVNAFYPDRLQPVGGGGESALIGLGHKTLLSCE